MSINNYFLNIQKLKLFSYFVMSCFEAYGRKFIISTNILNHNLRDNVFLINAVEIYYDDNSSFKLIVGYKISPIHFEHCYLGTDKMLGTYPTWTIISTEKCKICVTYIKRYRYDNNKSFDLLNVLSALRTNFESVTTIEPKRNVKFR